MVGPTALPLRVAAVITPPVPSLIAPADFSVVVVPLTAPLMARSPAVVVSDTLAPPLSGPLTASACALVSAKPAAVKLPSVPMWLAPFSVVAPADWPLSVPAVRLPPAPSLIAPADFSRVLFPSTAPLMARSPAVVVSDTLAARLSGAQAESVCAVGRAKLEAVKLPSVPMWLAPFSVVAPADWPLSVPAVRLPPAPSLIAPADFSVVVVPLTAPLMARSPAVVVSDTLAPPLSGPLTASACALVSAKPAAVKLPSVPMWLAPFSVVAPADWPLSVPAVRLPPAPSLIAPADFSVVVVPLTAPLMARSPAVVVSDTLAPPLSGPLTASACALVSAKPAAVKLPSVPMWLAPFSVVAPADWPLSVPAVRLPPAPSLIAPADFSVVVVPLTAPLMARSPAVVVSDTLAPPLSGPLTASACALVSAKPAAVKLPSVPMWLAPFSVVAPADWPLSVPAVRLPPAPSLIAPADFSVVVVPLTAPLMARSPA